MSTPYRNKKREFLDTGERVSPPKRWLRNLRWAYGRTPV